MSSVAAVHAILIFEIISTHWGLDQMAKISQTINVYVFSAIKLFEYNSNVVFGIQLTMNGQS